MKVSVCLMVKNVERHLERVLRSLPSNIDEIVILDGFSTDKTVKIAKKFRARVFQRKFSGSYADERNYCISKASNDWILMVDGDEIITSDLKASLEKIISSGKTNCSMYCVPRKTFTGTKFRYVYYSYPNFKPILFDRRAAYYFGVIHETLIVNGNKKFLPQHLVHYHDNTRNWWTVTRYAKLNKMRRKNREVLKHSVFGRVSNAWFYFKSIFFDLKFYRSVEGWKYSFGYIFHLISKVNEDFRKRNEER